MARTVKYFIFQDKTTTVSNGYEWITEQQISDIWDQDSDTLVIEIIGTTSGSTVNFEIKVTPDGDYSPVAGIRINDFKVGTSTTGIGEVWTFEIGSYYSFRCRVSDMSGGDLTINSRITKYN